MVKQKRIKVKVRKVKVIKVKVRKVKVRKVKLKKVKVRKSESEKSESTNSDFPDVLQTAAVVSGLACPVLQIPNNALKFSPRMCKTLPVVLQIPNITTCM